MSVIKSKITPEDIERAVAAGEKRYATCTSIAQVKRHCQVCGDPEPASSTQYLIGGKTTLQCCGKCREFIEAGGYSDDPDWWRFLETME